MKHLLIILVVFFTVTGCDGMPKTKREIERQRDRMEEKLDILLERTKKNDLRTPRA